LLWQVGSVLAVWGSCRLLARFFEEPGADRLSLSSSAVAVPVFMTGRLILENLQHAQINLYLLFLVLLAFHLFREGRAAWGAGALAVAASLKAVPVLFVAYLAYRRRWRETLWTVGLLIALNLVVPVALFGPSEAAKHWRAWRAVASAEFADPTPRFANQSLLAAVKRGVTVEGGARDPVQYALAAWSPGAARRLYLVLVGLAGLGLALAFRRRTGELRDHRTAVEIAVCLGALPIVSPLGWKAHYGLLLAPYWAAWWGLRHVAGSRRARWVAWWLSFACLTLSAEAIVGRSRVRVLESLNVILIGGLLVVGLALWVRARMPPDPIPAPPPPGASSAGPP
ncbi:MAG: glycosyltransferase family 87 protein, partial [Acidimicrobiales bacterium]